MREVAKEYLRIENAKSTASEEKVDRCEEGREEYREKNSLENKGGGVLVGIIFLSAETPEIV